MVVSSSKPIASRHPLRVIRGTWKCIGLAVLSGMLLFLASPGEWSFPFLAWFALVPLQITLPGQTFRRGALLGLICGFTFFVLLLSWVIIALGTYGLLPLHVSLPALILLSLYMGSYTSLYSGMIAWIGNSSKTLWIHPLLWVALDYIRGHLLTGFPWQDLAYSQFRFLTLVQLADITGHYGLTFLILLVNGLISSLVVHGKSRAFALGSPFSGKGLFSALSAVLLLVAVLAYGRLRLVHVSQTILAAPSIPITVVQGNIDQSEKWLPEQAENTIAAYLDLSRKATAGHDDPLVIWPETALPFPITQESPLTPRTAGILPSPHSCLLTGVPHEERNGASGRLQYFNRAVIINKDQGVADHYDKVHLVPFGEFIPFRSFLPFASPVVETMADFSPGNTVKPLACHENKIGVLICFESIFPELARLQAKEGATLLANITNDAWFGRSRAPWQHLSMVVFRAVETRRALARAANTGFSCVIQPDGRIEGDSPLFEPYAQTSLAPLMDESTIYMEWGRFFAPLCVLLSIAAIFLAKQYNTCRRILLFRGGQQHLP